MVAASVHRGTSFARSHLRLSRPSRSEARELTLTLLYYRPGRSQTCPQYHYPPNEPSDCHADTYAILMAACFASQAKIEPAHAQNAVFSHVLGKAWRPGVSEFACPQPRLVDGQDADAQRNALRKSPAPIGPSMTCCATR